MEIFGITLHSVGLFFLILAVAYIIMVGLVLIDLKAGIKKAKAAGEYRSSKKLRRTVDKFDKYFTWAMAWTLVDCAIVFGVTCTDATWFPHFPFMTYMLGVGYCAYCEITSIREKWEDKDKMDWQDFVATLAKLQRDGKIDAVKSILESIQKNDEVKKPNLD